MRLDKLLLRASWGGRDDPFDHQVDMMWDCLQRLAAYGGFLADPWKFSRRHSYVVSDSKDELRRYMTDLWDDPDALHYSITQSRGYPDDDPPHGSLTALLIRKQGYEGLAANGVVMTLKVGKHVADEIPFPFDWLLSIGQSLVHDFVDIWQPDACSLDSTELVQACPSRDSSYPVVGFMSWLSDDVLDPTVHLPPADVCDRYQQGTLIGVNPSQDDPLTAALDLATRVYTSGALTSIPPIQTHQPHSH